MRGTLSPTGIYFIAGLLICGSSSEAALPAKRTVRHFELSLTWEKDVPDGYQRYLFKVNGQFPSPTVEANQGDDVVALVRNNSPYNTTIHCRGIEMKDTPWSDGVPGISQNDIQPNCTFTYEWKATQHGSYFYHAHSDSLISDGLYGGIVTHPDPNTSTPYNIITNNHVSLRAIQQAESARMPLILSDWRHITSSTDWAISQQSRIEHICFDSILVNGKGNKNLLEAVPGAKLTDKSCVPPEVLVAAFTSPSALPVNLSAISHNVFYGCHEAQVLDLIGTFSLHTVQVSIDELTVWVIAADGNFIEPSAVNSLLIANGQRTILVKLDLPKRYTIRVSAITDPQILYGTTVFDFQMNAVIQSQDPSIPWINERGSNLTAEVAYFGPIMAKPYPPPTTNMSAGADATYKFNLAIDGNNNHWALNTTSQPVTLDDGMPMLFHPEPGPRDNHTVTVPFLGAWVDCIFLVPRGHPPHPIHTHGRHFYVLGVGSCPGGCTVETRHSELIQSG
ncbi:multicopper oxidase [Xylariaceae sp. FL0016]|nr:multicopper oxidase [Xylariaceae sp. FL0016]